MELSRHNSKAARRLRPRRTSLSISCPTPLSLTTTTAATSWRVRKPLPPRLARGRLRTIRSSLRLTKTGLRQTLRRFMSEPISRSSLQTRAPAQAATHLSCSLVWERSKSLSRTAKSRGRSRGPSPRAQMAWPRLPGLLRLP